jgi:hypothetical protein
VCASSAGWSRRSRSHTRRVDTWRVGGRHWRRDVVLLSCVACRSSAEAFHTAASGATGALFGAERRIAPVAHMSHDTFNGRGRCRHAVSSLVVVGCCARLSSHVELTHARPLQSCTEFGEVGIDDALLAKNTRMQADEEIIEMMNGCICCTVRKDLVEVLAKLAKRVKAGTLKLDGIIIETTGMADPAPVAQTFFVDDVVKEFAYLDGIVTLIDAKHIEQHLDDEKAEGASVCVSS